MYTYVNNFTFSTNDSGTEVLISLRQRAPAFSDHLTIESFSTIPVADIMMTPQLAREFAQKLLEVFEEPKPEMHE